MASLVCNGSTLYRRASSLVRTPISVILSPVEMAYYALAGTWTSGGIPVGGCYGTVSSSSIQAAWDIVQGYWSTPSTASGKIHMWRKSETGKEPENIFYMGKWATSMGYDQGRGEAYAQLGAYRFRLPTTSMNLTGIRLRVTHGGEICAYQNPNYSYAASENFYGVNWNATSTRQKTWKAAFYEQGWDEPTWEMKCGYFPTLASMQSKTCSQLYAAAQDTITANSGLTIGGLPRGYSKIWTGVDFGCIPIANTPYTQDYQLSDTIKNAILTNGGGWIVFTPNFGDSELGFDSQLIYWWLCESHWGYRLLLDFE